MNISTSTRIAMWAYLTLVAGAAFAGEPVSPVTPKPASNAVIYDGFVSFAGAGGLAGYWGGGLDEPGAYVEGAASVAVPLSGPYTLQTDVLLASQLSTYHTSGYSSDLDRKTTQGTVHLFWRDPAFASFGIVGQYTDESLSEKSRTSDSSYKFPFTLMSAGVEGQCFIGSSTLYLQVAYERIVDEFYSLNMHTNGVVLGSEFRTFFQPDLMTTLRAGYEFNRLSIFKATFDTSVMSVGAGIEYAPEHYPVSFFAMIDGLQQHYDTEWMSGEFEESARALVGIKYNFGGKSLFERDRNGASMTPLRPYRPLLGFTIPAG